MFTCSIKMYPLNLIMTSIHIHTVNITEEIEHNLKLKSFHHIARMRNYVQNVLSFITLSYLMNIWNKNTWQHHLTDSTVHCDITSKTSGKLKARVMRASLFLCPHCTDTYDKGVVWQDISYTFDTFNPDCQSTL